MLSFHGKQEVKDFYLARANAHFIADEIVKGAYWEDGKGCAVGCLIHGNSHIKLSKELGIPLSIARLIDRLFEGMPNENSKSFPVRFIESIPVGVDLSLAMDKFYLSLLSDPEHGVLRYANDRVRPSIQGVIDLFTRKVAKDNPSIEEWVRARMSAYADATADAAGYAAATAAAAAYVVAADAAAYAASAAAYAAHADADDAASRSYLWQSELLLKLLKEAALFV
jgi:hypothetical protein